MTTLFDIKAHKGDIGGSTYTPYNFNGKELDQETGYYYYGARYYDPSIALWFGVDPLASKYPMNSPYVYCNGNPVKYIDPDGNNPLDPRTGKEYSFGLFGLYRAAVYDYDDKLAIRDRVIDESLYSSVNRRFLGDREFNKPDGLWDGAIYNKRGDNLASISEDAYNELSVLFPSNNHIRSSYGAPKDNVWRTVAKIGTYDFIDNIWDESLWLHSDITEFNILSVEKNKITKIVNFKRPDGKSQYNINSVSTYEYLDDGHKVKETIKYYENNKPNGKTEVNVYKVNNPD